MLNETTIFEIKKIIFKFLDPRKDKVFIFGSRATGNGRKFSDIDIGVKSEKKIESGLMSDIEEAFEESNIPYTIDIVDFSTISKTFENVAMKKIFKLN